QQHGYAIASSTARFPAPTDLIAFLTQVDDTPHQRSNQRVNHLQALRRRPVRVPARHPSSPVPPYSNGAPTSPVLPATASSARSWPQPRRRHRRLPVPQVPDPCETHGLFVRLGTSRRPARLADSAASNARGSLGQRVRVPSRVGRESFDVRGISRDHSSRCRVPITAATTIRGRGG